MFRVTGCLCHHRDGIPRWTRTIVGASLPASVQVMRGWGGTKVWATCTGVLDQLRVTTGSRRSSVDRVNFQDQDPSRPSARWSRSDPQALAVEGSSIASRALVLSAKHGELVVRDSKKPPLT